jgi:hypothetical protein
MRQSLQTCRRCRRDRWREDRNRPRCQIPCGSSTMASSQAYSGERRDGESQRRSFIIAGRSTGPPVGCRPKSRSFARGQRTRREAIRGSWTATTRLHLDLRLSRADVVIWLDRPRYVYFPRAVLRSVRNHGRARDDVGPGCPERFDLAFFKDWVWTYPTHSPHATCGNYGQPTCGNPLDHFEIARRSNKIQEPLASLADAGRGGQVKQAMTGMSRRRGIYIIGSTVGTNWTGFEVMEK